MNIKSNLLFFILSLTLSQNLWSQVDSDTTIVKDIEYSVGITPTALFNIALGLQINQKLTLHDRIAFGLESGYIFEYGWIESKSIHGLRLRPSVSFLIPINDKTSTVFGVFYNYRKMYFDIESEEVKGQGNYIETVKNDGTNVFAGLGLLLGIRSKSENFEYNFGLGIGSGRFENKFSNPDINSSSGFTRFTLFNADNRVENLPIVFLNVGINFLIR